MGFRDIRRSPKIVDYPDSRSHAIPLLASVDPSDDTELENEFDGLDSGRGSGEYALNTLKHTSSTDEPTAKYSSNEATTHSPARPRWRPGPWSIPSSLFHRWRRPARDTADEADTSFSYCSRPNKWKRPRPLRIILLLLASTLMLLGVIQFITITFSAIATLFPDDLDWIIDHWGDPGQPSQGLSHWPSDFTADIRPVACHSHNDYWRKVPLYSAIQAGCISVEADVWLYDEELFVGHSTYSLTAERTLTSLYIKPLLEILEKQNPITHFHPSHDLPPNGVFDTAPEQSLVLLIDFKTSGPALWPYVHSQLEPLRQKGYLTHFNGTDVIEGPITVVGTGNAPFNLVTANSTYRDIFFDAPLAAMADSGKGWKDDLLSPPPSPPPEPQPSPRRNNPAAEPVGITAAWARSPTSSSSSSSSSSSTNDQGQGKSGSAPTNRDVYSPANSYYASVSFTKSVGRVWRSRLSDAQLELVQQQIRGAHRRGLKVRYWGLPSWPRGLRNHIWHVLIREGVDVLNVDDLEGATRRDWRRRKGWWY